MKPEYLPTTIEGKLDHMVEECSEILQAIIKVKRFGPDGYHPDDSSKKTNISHLQDEVSDILSSLQAYLDALKEGEESDEDYDAIVEDALSIFDM